jgi:nicotinamidase-related amidase
MQVNASTTDIPSDWTPFVLLLIDIQRDFWPEQMASRFPHFPANVTRLLELCRAEGIEVIHLRASFQPDRSDWMQNYKLRGRIPCVEETPGVEVLPFALEQPGEAVFVKHTFDGFHQPELLRYLRQRGKRFVLTAGLVTSTCVLFTTASAMQHGFLATVVEDCCADEPVAHAHTLDRYGFVFERITANNIPDRYPHWQAALKQLGG